MWNIEDLQIKLNNNSFFEKFSVVRIGQSNIASLGAFISKFNDFFQLCEGVKGDAESILMACPTSKDIEKDKLCLGFFKDQELIAFIDIIKNFPIYNVMTIGYLLITSQKRSAGLGSSLVNEIKNWSKEQGFQKLRLGVQAQNEKVLAFWQKNNFHIKDTFQEKLPAIENLTYLLECNP